MEPEELVTARLRLRPLAREDHDTLYAIYADPEVNRRLITRPRSIEEFRQPFEHMLELSATLGMWAIIHKADGGLIGRCGFYPFSEEPAGTPELAYLLARSNWGQGLASEAAQACLDHAFSARHWPEVVAVVRPDNHASARVLRKIGMRRVGRVDVHDIHADLYHVTQTMRGIVRQGRGDGGTLHE